LQRRKNYEIIKIRSKRKGGKMQSVLQQREVKKLGIIGKIFKRANRQGFATELENALVSSGDISTIDNDHITEMMSRHRIISLDVIRLEMANLVQRIALGLKPDAFGERDEIALLNFSSKLGLAEATVKQYILENARRHYRKALEDRANDFQLTEREQEELKALRLKLKLPEPDAIEISKAVLQPMIQSLLSEAMADGMFSPAEEQKIIDAAQNLRCNLAWDGIDAIQDAKRLWQIRHGNMPPVQCPLDLQKSEICYHATYCETLEVREKTVAVRYGGPAVSIKIVKGVYYRAGSYSVDRKKQAYHHSFGQGELCLTNKRILFLSPQRSLNIPYAKIIQLMGYSDGIEIRRDTGKPIIFSYGSSERWFIPILERLLADR
jgi:hypothetical protein